MYLVPLGRGRFELYAEPPSDARHGDAQPGWFARLRDRAARLALATVGNHGALWSLRGASHAVLVHPNDVAADQASFHRDRLLRAAARRHVWWMSAAIALSLPALLLALVPGPNLIGYYVAGRGVGHFLSWHGAHTGRRAAWTLRAEPALAELGALADLPRADRASRVDALAARLRLARLATFFDRAAVPARS